MGTYTGYSSLRKDKLSGMPSRRFPLTIVQHIQSIRKKKGSPDAPPSLPEISGNRPTGMGRKNDFTDG